MNDNDPDRLTRSNPRPDDGDSARPLLASVIHDLRNCVAPIRNVAQMLRMRNAAPLDTHALADLIDRQINGIMGHLSRLAETEPPPGTVDVGTRVAGPQPAVGGQTPRRRILIADDNAALRQSLGSVLLELGHTTREAADGAEALRVARDWRPDVAIIDVNMPELNGFDLARRLRAEFSPATMKLVMMSGDTLSDVAVRGARNAGFDHCIDKLAGITAIESIL